MGAGLCFHGRCRSRHIASAVVRSGHVDVSFAGASFKYDGITIDRDVNGARNILLRAMRDSSATAEMPCAVYYHGYLLVGFGNENLSVLPFLSVQ